MSMNMSMFQMLVAEKLREMKRPKAWLAQKLGYSPATFDKWMKGTNRIPYDIVKHLCVLLDFEIEQQMQLYDFAGYSLPQWVNTAGSRPDPRLAAEGEVTHFDSTEEMLRHLVERLDKVSKLVCDLTWGIVRPNYYIEEEQVYQAYLERIASTCRRGVVYREIMTFNNDPLHFFNRADWMLSQNLICYNLRFLDVDLGAIPPFLHCTIFDKHEVMVGLEVGVEHSAPSQLTNGTYVFIRHPAVASLFQNYFDLIWNLATRLKEGDKVYQETFSAARTRFQTL